MKLRNRPVVLIILDGFGIADPIDSNAITSASTPYIDKLTQNYPTMLINASGLNVGLPWGEVGNSEVGHVNIGSGVLLYQSLPRINISIEKKEFFKKSPFLKAIAKVNKYKSNLHLIGMIGNGGIHSFQNHLEALVDLCKKNKIKKNLYYHLILDGRDTAKDAGAEFMKQFLKYKKKIGEVATIHGRYYAMDRNNHWDRIKLAYDAICNGKSDNYEKDPVDAIKNFYKKNIFDEKIVPTVISDKKNKPTVTIKKEDAVILFNYRADRARQLTEAFVTPEFSEFERNFIDGLTFVTFTEYKKGLPVDVVFPPHIIKTPIAKVFSDNNLKQLHIAETEKYAHVTFFLNGQLEEKFPGEDRILIDSPAVSNYAKTPEMSAYKVTEQIEKAIASDKYDFIAVNFANPDMIGHTGDLYASIQAIHVVDECLKRIIEPLRKKNGIAFLIGDHGNAEELVNLKTKRPDKEHSVFPVPFITVAENFYGKLCASCEPTDMYLIKPSGILADITPTILQTVGLPLAPEMEVTNLLS